LPLFATDIDGEVVDEPAALLPRMTLGEEVIEDYVSMRLTLKAHPVALLRHILTPGGAPVDVLAKQKRAPNLSKISLTRSNPD
jgi:error-prone DNA polymerase